MSYNKYNNQKTVIGNIKFDSKAEAERYLELRQMQKDGEISDLRLQVPFELIPTQREPEKTGPRGGKIKGKVIHKAITYVADFVYTENGEEIVEDCKGMKTQVYNIKKKLFYYRYGKDIVETSEKRKIERQERKKKRERRKQEALNRWKAK